MKRLLSLVLVCAFALPLVIGCGDETKKTTTTPTKAPDAPKAPAGDKKAP